MYESIVTFNCEDLIDVSIGIYYHYISPIQREKYISKNL